MTQVMNLNGKIFFAQILVIKTLQALILPLDIFLNYCGI